MSDEPDGMLAYLEAIQNPSRDDPNWPLPSFDAKDWAEAFHKQFPTVPEDVALTWFANALMRGFDEHAFRGKLAAGWAQRPALFPVPGTPENAALAREIESDQAP